MPTFYSTPPSDGEVLRILWNGRAAVVSYIVNPDEHHPHNAWLYVCRDPNYSLDKLSKPARRDARRAQRSLQFGSIALPVLLDYGFPAYQGTYSRIGLAGGTPEEFQRGCKLFSQNPAHHIVAAWSGHTLVAFMWLVVVDDWVEIQAHCSTNTHRDVCPNDGLVNYVLEHFLVQRGFRIVSYGLSSVEENADKVGLHGFKKKVGFETQPVHRAFILHPLLRPFANRIALWGVQTALRFYPEGRLLRKAGGVLASVVKEVVPQPAEG